MYLQGQANVTGIQPDTSEVNEMMIADLLKYNSGMKAFQSVGSKTLSPSIDGFCLKNQCWLTKRPKTAAATASVRS